MTYVVWCLVVVVAILVWHLAWAKDGVATLRRDVDDLRDGERDMRVWRCSQLDSSDCIDFAKRRTESLARALGYEWKRTDAKEGWEKKSPFGFGDYDAYKESVKRAFGAPPLWIHAGPAACVADRRKADRRKPAGGKATLVHGDEPCGFCKQRVPAKKRRAH